MTLIISIPLAYDPAQLDKEVVLPFTEVEFEEFKTKKIFGVLYAKAIYKDSFQVDHWTQYCIFISGPEPGTVTAKNCSDYNRTDNN